MDTNPEMLTTGKFKIVVEHRYPNLDPSWVLSLLDEMNRAVQWFREKLSGNARMCVPWSGGRPGETAWEVPVNPLGEPKRKRKRSERR